MDVERWRDLMAHDSGRPPLAESAALVASARNPRVDPDALIGELEELASGCTRPTVEAVRTHLFDELGFRGDLDDYHHEHNTLLDQVLHRRRGLPIALSIICHDVAARLGVELALVAMPGHVIVRDLESDTFIDGFGGGTMLDSRGVAELFAQVNGPAARFDPSMLDATPHTTIVARMLSNLISRYLAANDWRNARWALELRAMVPGWPSVQNVDLAVVLDHLGAVEQAARVWDTIAATLDPERAALAHDQARRIRARLN